MLPKTLLKVANLLLCVIALVVATACSTTTTPANPVSGDCEAVAARNGHTQLKDAVVATLPIPDGAAAQIALSRCYFALEGIRAKIQPIPNVGAAIPGLRNGEIHVSLANYVGILQAEAQDPGAYKYVGEAYEGSTNLFMLATLAEAEKGEEVISKVEQLRGKTIAIAAHKSIAELQLHYILQKPGLSLDDVKVVEMPFPNMQQALQSGQVDAALVTEPFLTLMLTGKDPQTGKVTQAKRVQTIADGLSDAMNGFPISGWVTYKDTLRKDPDLIAGIAKALHKAQTDAALDQSVVRTVLPQYTKIAPETAKIMNIGVFRPLLNEARLKRVADALTEVRWLEQPVDVNPMLEFARSLDLVSPGAGAAS